MGYHEEMRRLLAVALLVSAPPAFAAQAVAVSVEELARTSDAVIRGRVLEATAAWSEDHRRIYTTFEVRRDSVLRGRAPARPRVVVPGGVIGGVGQRVDAAPTIAPGEDVVLFLQRTKAGTFHVNGFAQGKFTVEGRVARPDLSHLTFQESSIRAAERRVEEMPLAELERRVRSTR